MVQSYVGKIVKIIHSPSQEIVAITINIGPGCVFKEGQFMVLQTESCKDLAGNTIKRAYSIASSQQHYLKTGNIECIIKRTSEYGLSNHLVRKAKIGDTLGVTGPGGVMINHHKYKNYMFIANGSGLPPVLAIYQELLETQSYEKISFIFGERNEDALIPEIMNHFYKSPNIKTDIFLSKPKDISYPLVGHVQQGISQGLQFLETHEISVFICGKPAMVQEAKQLLQDLGIHNDAIHTEAY